MIIHQQCRAGAHEMKITEWLACVFGVTSAFCAATGDAMQFSVYAIAAVFMFALSRAW